MAALSRPGRGRQRQSARPGVDHDRDAIALLELVHEHPHRALHQRQLVVRRHRARHVDQEHQVARRRLAPRHRAPLDADEGQAVVGIPRALRQLGGDRERLGPVRLGVGEPEVVDQLLHTDRTRFGQPAFTQEAADVGVRGRVHVHREGRERIGRDVLEAVLVDMVVRLRVAAAPAPLHRVAEEGWRRGRGERLEGPRRTGPPELSGPGHLPGRGLGVHAWRLTGRDRFVQRAGAQFEGDPGLVAWGDAGSRRCGGESRQRRGDDVVTGHQVDDAERAASIRDGRCRYRPLGFDADPRHRRTGHVLDCSRQDAAIGLGCSAPGERGEDEHGDHQGAIARTHGSTSVQDWSPGAKPGRRRGGPIPLRYTERSHPAVLARPAAPAAGVVKLADAPDSKSGDRKVVGVRFPPPAPLLQLGYFAPSPGNGAGGGFAFLGPRRCAPRARHPGTAVIMSKGPAAGVMRASLRARSRRCAASLPLRIEWSRRRAVLDCLLATSCIRGECETSNTLLLPTRHRCHTCTERALSSSLEGCSP